jgi:hypothetical protein
MSENEIAEVDEYRSLFAAGTVDCHSWVPLEAEIAGAWFRLDFCSICGEPRSEHPDDAFGDDE